MHLDAGWGKDGNCSQEERQRVPGDDAAALSRDYLRKGKARRRALQVLCRCTP